MHHIVCLLFISLAPRLALSQTLWEVLIDAGAADFAAFIQSDPVNIALYESGSVRTIFAPADEHCSDCRKRQGPSTRDQSLGGLHASRRESQFAMGVPPPGEPLETMSDEANLGGQNQTVVADSRASSQPNSTAIIRRTDTTDTRTPPTSLYKIASGLGNTVNVIRSGIRYEPNNITINIVDDFFTLPKVLSETAELTGQTTFAALLEGTNQTTSFNSLSRTTFFVPSNKAFEDADAGLSTLGPKTSSLLAGHVVPDCLGYLPSLTDGRVLTDENGNSITVTVRNGEFFVGGAKIIKANQILHNGVAHIIDKVLTPPAPETVPESFASALATVFWPGVLTMALLAATWVV